MLTRMGHQLLLEPAVARALREAQPDQELASAAAHGDEAAFDVLARRHRARLFAVCKRVLRDDAEAEEAVQEALLSAYQHMGSFEGRSKFTTWLHTIAVNSAKMRLRKRRPTPQADIDTRAHTETALSGEAPRRPDHVVFTHEHARATARALETLDRQSREALVGRFLERPLTELARDAGISVGGVKTRIFRARADLKRQLAASGLGTTLELEADVA